MNPNHEQLLADLLGVGHDPSTHPGAEMIIQSPLAARAMGHNNQHDNPAIVALARHYRIDKGGAANHAWLRPLARIPLNYPPRFEPTHNHPRRLTYEHMKVENGALWCTEVAGQTADHDDMEIQIRPATGQRIEHIKLWDTFYLELPAADAQDLDTCNPNSPWPTNPFT